MYAIVHDTIVSMGTIECTVQIVCKADDLYTGGVGFPGCDTYRMYTGTYCSANLNEKTLWHFPFLLKEREFF